MLKEITGKDVIEALRQHETRFSKYPNSNNLLVLERQGWNEDAECPESFDVEIRFTHPNYIYLISVLYGENKGMITDGHTEIDIFTLVPRMKTLIKQLRDDGYLNVQSQKCSFHTEFGKEVVYEYGDGEPLDFPFEKSIDARARFTKEELDALNSSINLTTKGKSITLFVKERLVSEPIGTFSLLMSLSAILVSIFLK